MDNIIFVDIEGYEGLYGVSECGQVYSYKRKLILTPCVQSMGYHQVALYGKPNKKTCYVHRLVAEAFLVKPNNKDLVNHIDHDKSNNHLDNLEWCNDSENQKDRMRHG